MSYLTYGSFSSYAPIYDSTTANLSKDDSDLLLSAYGDETGIQYAKRYAQRQTTVCKCTPQKESTYRHIYNV